MLVSPPRIVPGLTFLALVLILFSYVRFREQAPEQDCRREPLASFEQEFPKPTPSGKKIQENAKHDPLDFSIPIQFKPGAEKPPGSNYSMAVVFPATKKDDVRWVREVAQFADVFIYEVDNPNSKHKVPVNKGRESMVYLTYLIDHYDSLRDITVFMHAHRKSWHNNYVLQEDSLTTLQRLRPERVARMGYMNTRCEHDPGCPDWIHMDRPAIDFDYIRRPEEIYFRASVWQELHPGAPVPPSLAQPCCAQFAVSRERVRQVPRERLEHYRKWLAETKLNDQTSGRIMEYVWHYIFTGNTQYCPPVASCLCDGFGLCFGGERKYQQWLKLKESYKRLLKERMDIDFTRRYHEHIDEGRVKELGEKIRKIGKQVVEGMKEAKARGENPYNREMERESLDDAMMRKFLGENRPPKGFDYELE